MAAVRRDSTVEGIEGKIGEDLAGNNAVDRLRSGNTAEGDEIE